MTTLKQGDLIKDTNGGTRKVLGVCGEAVLLSYFNNHHDYCSTETEASLKKEGYTWDPPAWEPSKIGETYWFIDGESDLNNCEWTGDSTDHARKNFLGIHQTRELCEAALLEIRRKLGK